jgi:DNA-binding CsgD family transcriptional regulator
VTPVDSSERLEQLLDEAVRLLALEFRYRIETQNEAIIALAEAGFGPKRISELLGTTPNTVNVSLSRSRRMSRPSRPASHGQTRKDE